MRLITCLLPVVSFAFTVTALGQLKVNGNVVAPDPTATAPEYTITWTVTPAAPGGTQFEVFRGDPPSHPVSLTETDPEYIPQQSQALTPTAGVYTVNVTHYEPSQENDFEIVALDASGKMIGNSGIINGGVPRTSTSVIATTPPPATAANLKVNCPANTATVNNACFTIDNFVALAGSGYAAPVGGKPDDDVVHAALGTMTYPADGNLPAMPSNACGIDPKANATLFSIVDYNSDQTAATPQWYLYEPKGYKMGYPYHWTSVAFNNPARLYGITKLQLVSVLLNAVYTAPAIQPMVTYVIQSTQAQPTNESNFLALLSIVGGNATVAGALNSNPKPSAPANYIGCKTVDTGFSTSTLQVTASIPDGGNTKLLTASNTITNEAKAWWDISLALPVKKASALQYNSTANTVTATQLNKQSLFATADLYPFRTDLKAAYSFSPAFFVGVSLASKPLDSILTGVSIHFAMASVYVGALWIKQQQLSGLAAGATATPAQLSTDTTFGFQHSFSIGIKLSAKSTASQLSSAKK